MKKSISVLLVAATALFFFAAYAAQPGTDDDPLVTKSFIEGVVYPHIKSSTRFNIVEVSANKNVICEAGTEIILRMGTCTVIGTNKGGLSDVTMGFDLPDLTVVQGNHLLIVPVADGRGIRTTTNCILMIKGGYTIN